MDYNLQSDFDVYKHVIRFPHYLEVIIDNKGKVHYAVPSHQEKLIRVACDKFNCTREQLNEMCPPEYYFDFLQWLLIQTDCVSVWTQFIQYHKLYKAQYETLQTLKSCGAYEGIMPDPADVER